ncbi:alginate O-acetyltransferase AlgX-related protein [Pseudescherichia sp.]|uniref:alginate O-acetyltransferase AlgX-related protein n=1 Tax=Pseudescherichia sp. TaxID=2055881 RepID=UPI00289D64F4|nr:hypothetical protein [Pseudescherichia sp.]
MKKYINSFLAASVLGMSIIPAVNIYNDYTGAKNISRQGVSWFHHSNLFNFDFTLPYLGYIYYKNGMSISPENVIVGKEGWLFLGDRHAYVMSESRGLMTFNKERMDRYALARAKWDKLVKEQGGIGYFVSIAPNSHSIYREMMPVWAAEAKHSPSVQYLLSKALSDKTLADLSLLIKKYKDVSHMPLYYKTDTHWNAFGAWYGYQALQNKISETDPSLKWLSPKDIHLTFKDKKGGDLSRFLRITPFLQDKEAVVTVNRISQLHITDWNGKTIRDTNLSDRQGNMESELIVNSSNALNNKRVLWLRDSFGEALYPYMNATFSTVIQRHYQNILSDPKKFRELINQFKPDLVIITSVERNSLSGYFGNFLDNAK